jgi:hypothetical protein
MELSIKILNDEFVKWMHRHGVGRNEEGLRFGQFVLNKYSISARHDIKDPMGSEDGFYDEAPSDAYSKLSKLIV